MSFAPSFYFLRSNKVRFERRYAITKGNDTFWRLDGWECTALIFAAKFSLDIAVPEAIRLRDSHFHRDVKVIDSVTGDCVWPEFEKKESAPLAQDEADLLF